MDSAFAKREGSYFANSEGFFFCHSGRVIFLPNQSVIYFLIRKRFFYQLGGVSIRKGHKKAIHKGPLFGNLEGSKFCQSEGSYFYQFYQVAIRKGRNLPIWKISSFTNSERFISGSVLFSQYGWYLLLAICKGRIFANPEGPYFAKKYSRGPISTNSESSNPKILILPIWVGSILPNGKGHILPIQ